MQKPLPQATLGDCHWSFDISDGQCGSYMFSRELLPSTRQRTILLSQNQFLCSLIVFSSQLSQVFEEKNALSLQLRGSSRSTCESHQHYSEVLNRCLVLERQLQELQAADKSMVRGLGLLHSREKLISSGSVNCSDSSGCVSSSFSAVCSTFLCSFRSYLQQTLLQEHPKKRMSHREALTHLNCRSCS